MTQLRGQQSTESSSDSVHAALLGIVPALQVDAVLALYAEPWRSYHGQGHVFQLFAFARNHSLSLNPAQALALLFHDAVYVPGARQGRNEQASAALIPVLCPGLARSVQVRAQDIVRDTARHQATSPDARLVLDLDLSPFILAAQGLSDPSAEVWCEFRHLLPSDEPSALSIFWTARAKVLRELIQRRPLYVSEEFSKLPSFEQLAREYLASELARSDLRPRL